MILHPVLSLFLRVTPHLILGIILYHLDTISASGGLSFSPGKMYIKLTVASHRITPSISCPPLRGPSSCRPSFPLSVPLVYYWRLPRITLFSFSSYLSSSHHSDLPSSCLKRVNTLAFIGSIIFSLSNGYFCLFSSFSRIISPGTASSLRRSLFMYHL